MLKLVVRGRVELPTFRFSVGPLLDPDLCCLCVGTGDFYNQGYATRIWVSLQPRQRAGPRGDISLHDGGRHENPVAARGRLVASGR